MSLDVAAVRGRFPALGSDDVFFDNPGGTQVPQSVIDAVADYLRSANANAGGPFATSVATDDMITRARSAMSDLLGCEDHEVVFGANMTTLTFALSWALSHTLGEGDEVVVTRLDHDANVAPWTRMAQNRGAVVKTVDFDPTDCTLRIDQLEQALSERTRLVAVGYASNAVGTINPVAEITRLAHDAGALCFVDAVQFAPHGAIDVRRLGCDFLAVSAYKFFGPHVGVLYGRYDLLDRIEPYRVRPASPQPPGSFETGTLNHEGLAGVIAAVDYLAGLGAAGEALGVEAELSRRRRIERSMAAIGEYERTLCDRLINALKRVPGCTVYGLTDRGRRHERVPTVAFRLADLSPAEIGRSLAAAGIYVWDGDYYAVDVIERLGFARRGGMVRVGPVHYNTVEEIDRFEQVLVEIATSGRASAGSVASTS